MSEVHFNISGQTALGGQAHLVEPKPTETEIVGHWIRTPKGVERDETCERIQRLIDDHFIRLGDAEGGWSVLFLDPFDKRLWEYTHLQGNQHGGGPPALFQLEESEAVKKYGQAADIREAAELHGIAAAG